MAKKSRVPVLDFLEYCALRGFAGAVNALPMNFSYWIASRLGDLAYYLLPKRRRVASQNIEAAYQGTLLPAEKQKIVRETFRNLGVSLMEFFRMSSMRQEASQRFSIQGEEHLDRALARGKGVIFVVSHLGSWEYLSFLFYLRQYRGSVIVREIKNPYIYQWLQGLRSETRIQPIDRVHSAKGILRALKKNQMVAILIDQWAGKDGLWVDFFGTKTSTTSIPARLAHRTGAALVPGYCLRTSAGHYQITIQPEVVFDPGDLNGEMETTLRLNQQLEKEIRLHPGQWTWAHRRWKSADRYLKSAPENILPESSGSH